MSGRLIGIARAREKGGPMELLDEARITLDGGIEGDARGTRKGRQVTVLFREGWEAALQDADAAHLPWTTRRANLLLEGVEVPKQAGAEIRIGDAVLKVVDETRPCAMMEAAWQGLRAAMRPDWRGGVTCDVAQGGAIGVGDEVRAELNPAG